MIIQDMFAEDINRKINGVIKVDQDADDVIEQELNEYVITRELKKHFITFFNYYGDAFDQPTADMGVWISGFFGSGKSHFLKMLSYLLENKEVKGIRSVERFRKKFEDDPATFMLIDRATKGPTETILFNIDIEGFSNKDKTAVLRVFAKMFYNHLGFYGENLKVAMMERYIDQQGKTEEFRRIFEEKRGKKYEEHMDYSGLCNLRRLELRNVPDAVPEDFAQLRKLESLRLTYNYGDDLSWLKNARYQLKTLIIDNGVEDCEGLRYQKNIEDLQFFYHHITDVSPIEELTKIKKLDLGRNLIENEGNLREMGIEWIQITRRDYDVRRIYNEVEQIAQLAVKEDRKRIQYYEENKVKSICWQKASLEAFFIKPFCGAY